MGPCQMTMMENVHAERHDVLVEPTKIAPGLYFDMPRECYDAIKAANQSTLKAMLKESPAHARASILFRVEKDAWTFGTAFDKRILSPDNWMNDYVIWDHTTSTGKLGPRQGKVWDAFESAAATGHKIILRTQDVEAIELMAWSLFDHGTAKRQFTRAVDHGVCLVWRDQRTGLLMKALLDQIAFGDMPTIDDLKTMASVAPGDLERAIVTLGYDVQGATYTRGLAALGGNKPNILLTCVEKDARIVNADDELCHAVRVVEMDHDTLMRGNTLLDAALDLYQSCLTSGRWEAYPDRVELVSAPLWALREVER